MTRPSKLIVFSCGGKGGVGKTTVAAAIADYYAARVIPATLFDCDTENKQRGSLRHYHPAAEKLDIRTERGLDRFVDAAIASEAPVALADLAAGSGRDTFHWFDTMFDALASDGIRFTAVATITSAASSVETLFTWAEALRDRVHYLVVKNHVAGDDFGFFDRTEPGCAFVAKAKPAVIKLEARARKIQAELDNRGLTAAQAIAADGERRGKTVRGWARRWRKMQRVELTKWRRDVRANAEDLVSNGVEAFLSRVVRKSAPIVELASNDSKLGLQPSGGGGVTLRS